MDRRHAKGSILLMFLPSCLSVLLLKNNMETLHEIMNCMSRMAVKRGEEISKWLVPSNHSLVHVYVLNMCTEHTCTEAHAKRARTDVDGGNKQLRAAVRYKVSMALSMDYGHTGDVSS